MQHDDRTALDVLATAALADAPPHVFVQTLSGRLTHLPLGDARTVHDLKVAYMHAAGVPPDQQRVVHRGAVPLDSDTLADLGIVSGTLLWLVVRLRGD